jgi:membrane protein YdbS with pleckstrin-like domain
MRPSPARTLDKRAVPLWRLTALVGVVGPLALVTLIVTAMSLVAGFPWLLPGVSLGVLVVAALLSLVLVPSLRYRRWRYEVTEDEVDLQEGVMIVRRTLVPMTRVQHVDTSQGPLDRAFGLANVTVATAAGAHKIPALTLDDADVLRDRISQLARVAVDDV